MEEKNPSLPSPPSSTVDKPAETSTEKTVEKIVAGGFGLIRDEQGVILVEDVVPQDVIAVTRTEKRGGARFAKQFAILQPSPLRAASDCLLQKSDNIEQVASEVEKNLRCGGCDFLHIQSTSWASIKKQMAIDVLGRSGLRGEARERAMQSVQIIGLPDDDIKTNGHGLRRRVRMRIDEYGRLAFTAKNSHQLLAIDEPACVAVAPVLQETIKRLSSGMLRRAPAGAEIQLACDDTNHVSAAIRGEWGIDAPRWLRMIAAQTNGALAVDEDNSVLASVGTPTLSGEVANGIVGGPYFSDAATFTQATRFGGNAILSSVMRFVKESHQQRGEASSVLELFAGAGHLTWPLASLGEHVVAVEADQRALHWAEVNRTRGQWQEKVSIFSSFIDGALPSSSHASKWWNCAKELSARVWVVDPPRSGIRGFAAIADKIPDSVDTLVMVSCDLATGGRDLAIACQKGFVVQALDVIDAFPRTSHAEWVVFLRRLPRSGI